MSDLQTQTVETQPAPSSVTETSAAAGPGVEATTQTSSTGTGEETFFDGKDLPEPLKGKWAEMQKAYTQKTQGIAETKKYADAFRHLVQDKDFISWYEGRKNGSQKAPQAETPAPSFPTPSPEEWEAMVNDPARFARWQADSLKKFIETEYGPKLQSSEEKVRQLEAEQATQIFAQEHPDFWDMDKLAQEKPDDPGLMEIMTAAGLDLATAYGIGQRIQARINEAATKLAHQTVQTKVGATSEGRSPAAQAGGSVLKVKGDLSAAIRAAASEAAEGRTTTVRIDR